jgi:hypothetical protein
VTERLLKFSQSNPLGMIGFISISIRAMLRANPGSNCNAFAVDVELRKVRTLARLKLSRSANGYREHLEITNPA